MISIGLAPLTNEKPGDGAVRRDAAGSQPVEGWPRPVNHRLPQAGLIALGL